jgi:hypothetical protein
MKHLRRFENFDLGHRFSDEQEQIQPIELDKPSHEEEDIYSEDPKEEEGDEYCEPCDSEEGDETGDTRNWGDENIALESIASFKNFLNEKKATPAQLAARKAFAEKAKEKADKKDDKKDDKSKKEVSYKKSGLKNPEKADLDKNKKISGYEKARGKAVQDAIEDEKEEKGSKGLTAAQKKLPEGPRKAIEAKNKNKK